MKHVLFILALTGTLSAQAQKTTRESISSAKGVTITKAITETDTLFIMMGQNVKYAHITDIIAIKHGSAQDIDELLTECMKFLPEKSGTSLEYKGNTLLSTGRNQVLLHGMGDDDQGCVLLNKGAITKLQTDLRARH